jgi:PAS domain S-box-containing protein
MDGLQDLAAERHKTQPVSGKSPVRANEVLNLVPVAAYTVDRAGRITGYNDRARQLWGQAPAIGDPHQRFCGSCRMFQTDGTQLPHDRSPMAIALRDGRPVYNGEVVIERPDGSRITALTNITPLLDPSGALAGAMACLNDVTGLGRTAADSQRLASIVKDSQDAIISKNLDGVIETWNEGAQRIFGYTADEAVGKPITILIPENRLDEEPGILSRIRRGERIEHYETVRRRKDGTLIDISLTVSPVKGANGTIVGASKIARDITAQKQAEERMKLLAREVDHRAKNILATVQALVRMTRADSVPAYTEALAGRVRSLAQAHTLLAKSRWQSVNLRQLIEEELEPFGTDGDGHLRIAGPDIELSPDAGQGLGMALHELATNAAKYGAFSVPGGSVAVDWSVQDGLLVLRWTERGGPPVREPGKRGFGSGLIEAAVRGQLDGEVAFDWRPAGLSCELSMSTAKLAAP